jgi:putative peptidoglycan lipid II flippase
MPTDPPHEETAEIARAAAIIALGNITSRVLGLVRETVKSHYFGAGGAVDALSVATFVPTMIYDLLIGGMVSSALVPIFSEYAAKKSRDELWGLVSILLSLAVVVLALFILLVEFFAPQVAFLLSSGSPPPVLSLTARLLRLTVPAVLFLSLSGVLSGVLFALRRFSYPSFTAAAFNAAMVVVTLALHAQLDVASMALGLLVGAFLQVVLQLPGLRDSQLRFRLTLSHPGLRRIAMLYAPIVLGLAVDILISRPISYNLASRTGEGGISWMVYATTLIQFPQGLVATAISIAILPTLSVQFNGNNGGSFRATLARGLRLVIVLIIPAMVGLLILARPTVALLFEHGDFLTHDTQVTALALQLYVLGLPFAAVDLLLVHAFYAQQDTLTPALIGVGTIAAYLIIATLLLPTLGLFSLMAADSVKHLLHMVISWSILRRRTGHLSEHKIGRTLGISLAASIVMGIVTMAALWGIQRAMPTDSALGEIAAVGVPGVLGGASYLALVNRLGVEEFRMLWRTFRLRMIEGGAAQS